LAELFVLPARLYSETAVRLATLGESGVEYNRLLDETIKAHLEKAFKAFTAHITSHHCGEAEQNEQVSA
jgi:hypothetical protein